MEDPLRQSFWQSSDTALLLNPKLPCPDEGWLRDEPSVAGQVIFRTSGSQGLAKYVCLTRAALLASATAVNRHLKATTEDVWLGCLPTFHVGGLGIAVRAHAADCEAVFMESKWDPKRFTARCGESGATLTSLVPTQLYDLVVAGSHAPPDLRAVLVGGGTLERLLDKQARELGWPVLRTYGMTETASQVATQKLDASFSDPMIVLPIWEIRLATQGCLQVRGAALLSGYVLDRTFIDPKSSDGWYETTDHVLLGNCETGTALQFTGRHHGLVKIKGELISLQEIRSRQAQLVLKAGLLATSFTAIALPDARDEQRLVWVCDSRSDPACSEALRAQYNSAAVGPWRMLSQASVPALPRTELGKLAESCLESLVKESLEETSV